MDALRKSEVQELVRQVLHTSVAKPSVEGASRIAYGRVGMRASVSESFCGVGHGLDLVTVWIADERS
jgi:hypothetical protein